MLSVTPIRAFSDNYIWAIDHSALKQTIVIDPGQAEPVIQYLKANHHRLAAILVTHHHYDHTGGIEALCKNTTVPVYGPAKEKIPCCQHPLREGDKITFDQFDLTFEVLDIPGHTAGHIAFYGNHWLFCGDTLFAGGCGRLFEGTPQQMCHSLSKLTALPPDTQVYCAHEYTEANLKFAITIEPHNPQLQQRLAQTIALRENDIVSLPSTIEIERHTNPFLRADQPEVVANTQKLSGQTVTQPTDVFATIRQLKDNF